MVEGSSAKSRSGICVKLLKSIDVYGVPVSLTYKREPQIKSSVGGLATIIARILVLAYICYQCSLVMN